MQKLIIRTDDVGYTNVCNIGTFETYDRGFGTSADIMLDTPLDGMVAVNATVSPGRTRAMSGQVCTAS